MFGDLNDWNIYVNNQNGGFDDNASDQNSNFSYEENSGAVENSFETSENYGEPSMGQEQISAESFDAQQGVESMPGAGQQSMYDDVQIPGEDSQFEQEYQQPVPPKKSSNNVLVLVLFLLIIGAAGYFGYQKFVAQPAAQEEQATGDYFYDQASNNAAQQPPQLAQNTEPTATVDVDLTQAAPAPAADSDVAAPPAPAKEQNDNKAAAADEKKAEKALTPLEKAKLKMASDSKKEKSFAAVTIPVMSGGRQDPFLPYGSTQITNAPKFDLIAPPMDVPEADPVVDEMMQTKISGIMYEASRPSAIININGSDHLVHRGDAFNGYKILDITKDTVVIKYASNIYRATVGQALDDTVNINPNSNISNQFGGAYSGSSKNVIQIK